jgi:hypothetical protein
MTRTALFIGTQAVNARLVASTVHGVLKADTGQLMMQFHPKYTAFILYTT